MARIDPQINVRVEAEFKKKLEHAAIDSGRSLNAEVVRRLEQSFISTRVASDSYKRMLLAIIAGIVAEQADKEKPSFQEAIDKITKAIMVDEEWFDKVNGQLKNSEK